jgi:PAS domain S-box-containing protein
MKRRSSWNTIVIPVALSAVLVASFLMFWIDSHRHERDLLSLKTALTAQQVAIRLEDYISVRLHVAASMRDHWDDHIDSYTTYRNHAENIVENLGGLLALNWIDAEGVIRWVVPEEPNRAAKGQDLMANPVGGPYLREAMRTGKMFVTPPLDLYQGGRGIVAYIPIGFDSPSGEVTGFLNAVFRLEPMIEDCLARGVRDNFYFAIREGDELVYKSGDHETILGDPASVTESFRIVDRLWAVTLSPTPRLAGAASTTGHDFVFGLGLLMALAAGFLSWRVLDSRSKIKWNEARYRQILETAMEGIWTIDADANTNFVNDRLAEMLGYTVEEMMGRPVYDFMPEDAFGQASKNVARREAGIAEVHEFPLRREDGSELSAIMSTNPLYDARNEYIGALAMVSDITERKRAEEERRDLEIQMRQTQKLESLGVLAGGIAHDFNNLLTGIIGHAGLALNEVTGESRLRENIDEIDAAARRAAGLCQLMLTYSGKGQLEVAPVDLNELVGEMGGLLGLSISKKATIEYELHDKLPTVDADTAQIGQILMNLITNASEALGDETGVIVIRTGSIKCDRNYLRDTYLSPEIPSGRYVYMEVRDTGAGMDLEMLDRIFDPFFTTKFVGRGLGLAAVLGIIRSHSGTIKVESAPGLGTTFRVLLPVGRLDRPEPETTADSELAATAGISGRTILAVDDEEIVLSLIKRVLESAGAIVLTADNGQAAVESFRDHAEDIDCVVLDLTMPEMDGEETFRELRGIRDDVRVIISSGYAEEEVTERFEGHNVGDFISKPFRPNDLLDVVTRVLAGETDKPATPPEGQMPQ